MLPCISEYMRIYEKQMGIVKARVILARPADDETLQNIRSRLSAAMGKKLELQVETDPDLIGGLVIEMEGRRFDNSIRAKIRTLGAHIAENLAEE